MAGAIAVLGLSRGIQRSSFNSLVLLRDENAYVFLLIVPDILYERDPEPEAKKSFAVAGRVGE